MLIGSGEEDVDRSCDGIDGHEDVMALITVTGRVVTRVRGDSERGSSAVGEQEEASSWVNCTPAWVLGDAALSFLSDDADADRLMA